ncbi:MAG: DUF3016 domain-containing protein [Rhodanobacter sp.]
MSPYVVAAFFGIVLCTGSLAATPATPAMAATSAATMANSAARVSVTYANPQTFSENRQFGAQDRRRGSHYLEPLKAHLIKRATRMLPPNDRLDVTITDIKLAGAYEPWRSLRYGDVRIMRDIYPPRIDLTFKLLDANGTVLREGSRKLRNINFLHGGLATLGDSDPLRYDKALLSDWLRRGPEGL